MFQRCDLFQILRPVSSIDSRELGIDVDRSQEIVLRFVNPCRGHQDRNGLRSQRTGLGDRLSRFFQLSFRLVGPPQPKPVIGVFRIFIFFEFGNSFFQLVHRLKFAQVPHQPGFTFFIVRRQLFHDRQLSERLIVLVCLSQQIGLFDLQGKILRIEFAGFGVRLDRFGQVSKAGQNFRQSSDIGCGFQLALGDRSPGRQCLVFALQRMKILAKIFAVLSLLGGERNRLLIELQRLVRHFRLTKQFANLRSDQRIFRLRRGQSSPDRRSILLASRFVTCRIFQDDSAPIPQRIGVVRFMLVELFILSDRLGVLLFVHQLADQGVSQFLFLGGKFQPLFQPRLSLRAPTHSGQESRQSRNRLKIFRVLFDPGFVVSDQTRLIIGPQIDRLDPATDFAIEPVVRIELPEQLFKLGNRFVGLT